MTSNEQIALQLYTLREHTQQDMVGTLHKVAEMGYKAVELAGYGNSSPAEIRAALDAYGLKAPSIHAGIAIFEAGVSKLLADVHTLGCNYVVVPFIPKEQRNSEYVRQLVTRLNEWGKLCQQEGLQLGYHNHNFEFDSLADGSNLWEIIVEQTDSNLVKLELDIFWAVYAGKDPVKLITGLHDRVPLLHIKDMASDESRADVPVGEGRLVWKTILEAGRKSGSQWYIVEQDHPKDALNDVQRGLQNLERLLRAKNS